MSKSKPAPTALDEEQLRGDAFELAHHLLEGRGLEALEVVYGGSYNHPTGLASLLRYAAGVVQFRANQHPGTPS